MMFFMPDESFSGDFLRCFSSGLLSAGKSLCGPESALVGHAAVCGGFNLSPVLDYRFQANPSIVSASRPCTFYPSAQPLTGLRLFWWRNTSVIDA